jgi:hypothetical protein
VKVRLRLLLLSTALLAGSIFAAAHTAFATDASQQSFKTVVYIPVGTVLKMKDHAWLESSWAAISGQVHVDKVYVETYRSRVIADDALIEDVKKFFLDHGVEVAGGVCYSDVDNGQFASFTYTKAADRAYVKQVSELTAKHFDEVILDDFFFANTKTPSDIAAKGPQIWTTFRLKTMDEVSRDLVVGPMKAVNPRVKVIIKFPNWYEHFQGNGYDLENESKIFDGIYAGTETRDPVATDQNLQQYEGYGIVRYFEHIDPGKMGGGWVDTYSLNYIDRYSEQLWLTVFAKAKEMTLFNYSNLLDAAVVGERPWSGVPGTGVPEGGIEWKRIADRAKGVPTYATVAGEALDQVKPFIGKLGKPIGIASYRPYNGLGEDFLHNFFGMIGVPVEIYPTFPKDADVVLLTEVAKFDPKIVAEMNAELVAGKTVVITSGLLHALEGKGIEDLVELRYSAAPEPVTGFIGAFGPGSGTMLGQVEKPIPFPQIRFLTNDAWPVIRGIADDNAFPILLMDKYAAGTLYVLTVPDNFTDLYRIPEPALNALRSYIMGRFPVRIDAPAKVCLFAYDNQTLIVESFRDEPVEVTVMTEAATSQLTNLQTGESLTGVPGMPRRRRSALAPGSGEMTSFQMTLPPHSFAAFQEAK